MSNADEELKKLKPMRLDNCQMLLNTEHIEETLFRGDDLKRVIANATICLIKMMISEAAESETTPQKKENSPEVSSESEKSDK